MTLSADLISFVESEFRITQGHGAGENLRLMPWQKRFLRGFDSPGDLALSVARGAGKSSLASAIASAALTGPLARPRGEVAVVASSFAQGKAGVFDALLAGLPDTVLADCAVNNSQSYAKVLYRPTGSSVRVLGSDPRRLMGLQPVLTIGDELSSWPANTADAAISAIRTSLGKIPGSRGIWISTRAASSGHPFEKMLQGQGVGYAQVHAARDDDAPFQYRTWLRANPSLRVFESLRERVAQEAQAAKRDGALLQSFRALRLNQGVSDVVESLLLEANTWQSVEGDAPAIGNPVAVGIDLGSSAAMSAACAVWASGRLDAFAVFPAHPSLAARGLADGVGDLYRRMAARNELLVRGDRVADVPALLEEVNRRWGRPGMLVTDRWRLQDLMQACSASGFPLTRVESRGAGFKDGSADVRAFRAAVVGGKVTPVKSLLLRAAMSEARTVSDFASNAKLAKGSQGGRRAHARDDAAAAAILAVSAASRHQHHAEPAQLEAVLV